MNIYDVLGNGGLVSKVFKNYEEREPQIELAELINESYEEGGIVLGNAGTGTGKSLAGLIPAILNKKNKTVVSTSNKALQMQYWEKDLPMLHKMFNGSFSYAMLKGRSNYVCLNKLFEFQSELTTIESQDAQKIKSQYDYIVQWVEKDSENADLEEVPFSIHPILKEGISSNSDDCDNCELECRYKKVKAKAEKSDIILVNTDLLCTDFVARNMYAGAVLPHYDSVIIDEAHELEDIFSKYIGRKISHNVIKLIIPQLFKYIGEFEDSQKKEDAITKMNTLTGNLTKFSRKLFDEFMYYDDDGDLIDVVRLNEDDMVMMVQFYLEKVTKVLKKIEKALPYPDTDEQTKRFEKLGRRFDDIYNRMKAIEDLKSVDKDSNFVFWVEYSKKGEPIVNSSPIDISEYLRSWLFSIRKDEEGVNKNPHNIVLMSATISTEKNFDYIKKRLGVEKCGNTIREIIVDSPFDYKHQALLYLPKGIVEPNYKNRETFSLSLVNNIIELANISRGRMLCIFTSYYEMEKAYREVVGKLPYTLLMQGQLPKSELTKRFNDDIHSILFATSSFRQGVSFEGETATVVVMDKIPFPVPTEPLIEARIEKMKYNGEDWFNGYYVPQAIIAMQQAFGRLIRTKTDLGVVMLCDPRLVTKNYGIKFIRSLPKTLQTRNITKVKLFLDICDKKTQYYKEKGVIKE